MLSMMYPLKMGRDKQAELANMLDGAMNNVDYS